MYVDTSDAAGVSVTGGYAYVADRASGLAIIDVSDPANPGQPVYASTSYAEDVDVAGSYAYVADGLSGLTIIDVTEPLSPSVVVDSGIDPNVDTNRAKSVQVSGNYAYIADDTSGLAMINVADPHHPGAATYRSLGGRDAERLAVSGSYVLLSTRSSDGLALIDLDR